ncbi:MULTISPECIES: hypothetical protein [unclassified Sulfitobacter]|uniref:hypothetical protein n=1 Tax=unclassified Sulfitobacter TaxID=196795 RepID=UPI0023E309AE|nr:MULTISPECIES: hypothetical protein [unclassified Sulfitobacter]
MTPTTVRGQLRTVQVADYSTLPSRMARVHALGTTAAGDQRGGIPMVDGSQAALRPPARRW